MLNLFACNLCIPWLGSCTDKALDNAGEYRATSFFTCLG